MSKFLSFSRAALAVSMALPAVLAAQMPNQPRDLPLRYSGPPTSPQITPGDLMTRLYIFADDSLMGRQVGTEYNVKATAYIERELRRLGLTPAGDSGGFFQNIPMHSRAIDPASTVTADGATFKAGADFLASAPGTPRPMVNVPVIYGGTALDTVNVLPVDSLRGKAVLLGAFTPPPGFNLQLWLRTPGAQAYQQAMSAAAMLIAVGPDSFPTAAVRNALSPAGVNLGAAGATQETPFSSFTVTSRMAEQLLGVPLAGAAKGTVGKKITTNVRFIDIPRLGRNVVAIMPGSDPALKNQYIAIGAHNDHVGFRANGGIDHDSLRAFMQVVRPQGADSPNRRPSDEEAARVRTLTDSLHHAHPPRVDSIYNGADDDGSGSMAVLEIAEAFAKGSAKPKRSILFVWHTGEERGLWGADYFTEHPTVPRDSIVAQLNMDMVGRGGATDITGETKEGALIHGGEGYVQLVGSRRLSTELGDLIEAVNTDEKIGLKFDYAIDANGHPQNIYCRSDHYEYAKFGIPVVFFTTGGHADYHQVTDEPQYIDYNRMAQVSSLVYESALRIANLDHRLVVDKPKPDPKGRCIQ
jgi:hypothetical protein